MKIALPLLIAFGLAGAAVAQDAGKSVWQGIYTPEQADRGGGVYAQRCGACHGAALTGVQPATPGLLGLPRDYINAQLGAWRTGQRKAHAPDCMADIAQRLDIQDIAAVSAWLSTQRLPANTHAVAASATPLPMNCGSAQPTRAGGRP